MTTENGAIQPDAPKPDLNDPNVRMSRADAMKLIAAKRRETVVEDMDDEAARQFSATPSPTPMAGDTSAAGDEDANAADAAAEAARRELEAKAARPEPAQEEVALDARSQVQAQADDPLTLTENDLQLVRIPVTINGEQRMMTGAELRAHAQKVAAADDYLSIAKETLREARQAAGKTPPTDPAQGQQPATPAPAAAKPAVAEVVGKAVQEIFQGNPEGAAELLTQAMSGGAAQPVDHQQLTRMVEQNVVIRSALRQFAKDHKDIVEDPMARQLADRFLYQELQARGVARLEDLDAGAIPEAVEAAGRATKDYFRVKAGIQPGPTPTGGASGSLSERLNRKRAQMDELPAAAARASSHVPQPKTTTDVLNQMRQARGQAIPGS